MRSFEADTRVEGSAGRYRAELRPEWAVWGPMGGYVAAIALRAIGAESALGRPASFACQFLAVGRFEEAEVEVDAESAGRRARAYRARVTQGGRPLLAASAWMVGEALDGFEHEVLEPPAVPRPGALSGYQELAEQYADWYPFWRHVEGRPVHWSTEPRALPPYWRCWMRLLAGIPTGDRVVEAARAVLWLDTMMWNAACAPHAWPHRFVAPNLDLTAHFHAGAADQEWLLCDSHAPVAREGLVSCNGRVWTEGGALVASGTSHLLCRANPAYDDELARHRALVAERAQTRR